MRAFARAAAVAFAFALPAASAAQAAPLPPRDLDAYVARVLRTFAVPGVAVAIVKDGRVVLARGYGVKKLGDAASVTAHTRFGIASNTKLFTATALGLLVEDGTIDWDAPVIRYLPDFAMYDPWVTREITVRDLLVHRSGLGLGAGDLLWWPASSYDRKEIVRRLRFIRPATSFRSAYAYDNVLYQVAGQLVEAVSGQSWEQFMSLRILSKVGMTESNVSHADMSGPDVATPHAEVDGKVRPIAPFTGESTNPAGGINSTADDMAKWMIVQLDSGRLGGGGTLFAPATTRQLWKIVTPLDAGPPPAELAWTRANFRGYALGVNVTEYQGRKVLTHTGGLPGYVSQVTMLPELRLGVAVLTAATVSLRPASSPAAAEQPGSGHHGDERDHRRTGALAADRRAAGPGLRHRRAKTSGLRVEVGDERRSHPTSLLAIPARRLAQDGRCRVPLDGAGAARTCRRHR